VQGSKGEEPDLLRYRDPSILAPRILGSRAQLAANQLELCGPAQASNGCLSTQGCAAIRNLLAIDQCNGPATSCVSGSSAGVVCFQPAFQVCRPTGVQRAIGTFQDVDERHDTVSRRSACPKSARSSGFGRLGTTEIVTTGLAIDVSFGAWGCPGGSRTGAGAVPCRYYPMLPQSETRCQSHPASARVSPECRRKAPPTAPYLAC